VPRLATRPCHRLFAEFDASIQDVAEGGAWFSRINIRACQRNPRLLADLLARCGAALRGYKEGTLGYLPNTNEWREVIDPRTGKPEIEKTRGGEPVIDPRTGRPKVRLRWHPPIPPFRYADEPSDIWQAYSVAAEDRPGQTMDLDCDCLSPTWAAYFYLSGLADRVGIGVSQPNTVEPCPAGKNLCGKGMAHEYTILGFGSDGPPAGLLRLPGVWDLGDLVVFDGSVLGGMGEDPPPTGPSRRGPTKAFYGAGESAHVWI
jgi:hypothetical protein